jgi:hypothetical protein
MYHRREAVRNRTIIASQDTPDQDGCRYFKHLLSADPVSCWIGLCAMLQAALVYSFEHGNNLNVNSVEDSCRSTKVKFE